MRGNESVLVCARLFQFDMQVLHIYATMSHFTKCNTHAKVHDLSRIRLPKQMGF